VDNGPFFVGSITFLKGGFAMKRKVLLVVFCMMMGCLLTSNCLAAEDAAAFYKGKTLTVLIPSSPGGTFDLISRTMGSYLEKYTGAKTLMTNSRNIQIQNMLYRSKPDGLTVVLAGHGPKEITAQLFKQEGVNFDWRKFTLLGRLPSSSTAFVVDKKKGWKKPADLQGKVFFAAASSPFFEPLFAEACGWDKMSVIPGLSGGERSLGMRRGEIQGASSGAAQVVQDADLMLPIVVTTKDPKGFPGVPTASEVAVKGKEKWGSLAAAWDELLYWSYATPGTPQDRAAFLESALEKTFKDPAFRADMAKLKIDLSDQFINGKELRELARDIEGLSDTEIKEMQFVIESKYLKK
jgi:tripartite-type tricarboxylate transporter receptor subunit TctC